PTPPSARSASAPPAISSCPSCSATAAAASCGCWPGWAEAGSGMTANGHRLRLPPLGKSLSARVLLLTIAFVMLGEVLIYAPSAGRFRLEYLRDRLATAHVAILALLATPNYMVGDSLQAELMQHAGAYVVALKRPDGVKLMMRAKAGVPQVDATYDLGQGHFFGLIGDAFETLWQGGNRVIRVIGASPKDPKAVVEVVIDEAP